MSPDRFLNLLDPNSALPGSKTDPADAQTDPAESDSHSAQPKMNAAGAFSKATRTESDPVTSGSDPAVSDDDSAPAETVAADLKINSSRSNHRESRSMCNLLSTTSPPDLFVALFCGLIER